MILMRPWLRGVRETALRVLRGSVAFSRLPSVFSAPPRRS